MTKVEIEELGSQLDRDKQVTFIENNKLFVIVEGSYGWDVNMYYIYETGDNGELEVADGGMCTGTAVDAVEFLLDSNA